MMNFQSIAQDTLPQDMPTDAEDEWIENKGQLVDYLSAGCKPKQQFRLGAEQETFVFQGRDFSPATYDDGEPGIKMLLESLYQFDWQPIEENGKLIALSRGRCMVTLEPGGQFEFVGAPLENAHQTAEETAAFHRELQVVSEELGLRFLAIGHHPKHSRAEIPWMPKSRYRVMQAYMPGRGSLGLDMMQRTCAVQVTADFSSEADMVKKFRVGLALQPIAVSFFANSPFKDSVVGGKLSHRAATWSDTDPDRCGSLPFVFDSGMGFERYTDYVLDVPMYFVIREGQYIDASGLSFRDFMEGRLSVLPGQRPLLKDWVDHLSTVFPDVRLKQFLEFRGADAGDNLNRVPAAVALWAGLLYDPQSLDEAWERVKNWTNDQRFQLATDVVNVGFEARCADSSVQDLALWMLDLSRQGLERRNIRDRHGATESQYLEPLQQVAESGQTFAQQLIQRFSDQWNNDMNLALPAMCRETFS